MKLVFMGTPEFAVPSLELLAAHHEIAAVYTQPDRPSGRGQKLAETPVKAAAVRLGLQVRQPAKIKPEVDTLREIAADAIVVVGYGKIIPQSIIDLPRQGIINLHGSLLPKYRGAAPINWAIVNGETRTGVTTMMIDAGLDTGDMLRREEIAIAADDDTLTLGRKLAAIGAPLLLKTLEGGYTRVAQDDSQASIARILVKEDGRADWTSPAVEIERRVRGFVPWPGVYTAFRGSTLRITKAAVEDASGPAGKIEVLGRRLLIGTGRGCLEALEVQPEGKKRMSAADFMNGSRVQSGETVG